MKSVIKSFFVVVFFSFFFVACDGQEATLPDGESVVDETTDEDVVENDNAETDTASEDEDATEDDTENPDIDVNKRTVEDNEDCLSTGCANICQLRWNQETDKELKLFEKLDNGDTGICYITIWFQVDSDNNCYVNSEDGGCGFGIDYHLKDTQASKLPIGKEVDWGQTIGYFILSEQDSESKIFNSKMFETCIYYDEEVEKDWCEEKGEEKYQIVGQTGDFYLKWEINLIPFSQ